MTDTVIPARIRITPLADRVVIQPSDESMSVTAGGIIIPDTAKEKPQEGEVVAVGAGKVNEKGNRTKLAVKTGDNVCYSAHKGTEFTYNGIEYLIMSESDILALLE